MGSRRRAQSPSSVNKTSQWRLACVFRHAHSAPRCGYKRRARANAHQLFASEPSLQISRVSASSQRWCYGASAEVAVQCCNLSKDRKRQLRCYLPWALQRFLKENFRAKESSTSDGRLFKDGFPLVRFWMWSFSDFIWWSRSLPLVLGL